ncbi:helix-hairpin-helix domain-containing protein [Aquifex sp.]
MSGIGKGELINLYRELLERYGEQNWWPVDEKYHKKQGTNPREEIVIGAILTQNTNWRNVEKALNNLKRERLLSFEGIRKVSLKELEKLIKPVGFYRQKARYLKNFVDTYPSFKELEKTTREELLKIKGIGKETADAILLYALDRLSFVVDAYTKRLLFRLKGIQGNYEEIKSLFEEKLPRDLKMYKEFHALIDEHCKRVCKKKPMCEDCFLKKECLFFKNPS